MKLHIPVNYKVLQYLRDR